MSVIGPAFIKQTKETLEYICNVLGEQYVLPYCGKGHESDCHTMVKGLKSTLDCTIAIRNINYCTCNNVNNNCGDEDYKNTLDHLASVVCQDNYGCDCDAPWGTKPYIDYFWIDSKHTEKKIIDIGSEKYEVSVTLERTYCNVDDTNDAENTDAKPNI